MKIGFAGRVSKLSIKAGISSAMALRLSKAFHTSPGLWIGMQAQYDLWQAREGLDLDAVTAFVKE